MAVRSISAMQSLGVIEDRDSREPMSLALYTLFQNGCHFSVLLFACKLALVASFKGSILLNFEFKNEATRANLKAQKRPLK